MISERLLTRPQAAVTVSPGGSSDIVAVSTAETNGYDVYLVALGTAIDPTSNADFATMRLMVNGAPFYPFNEMTSQIAPASQPKTFEPPYFLGRSCDVRLKGEMSGSASGTTKMSGMCELILTAPGTRPKPRSGGV